MDVQATCAVGLTKIHPRSGHLLFQLHDPPTKWTLLPDCGSTYEVDAAAIKQDLKDLLKIEKIVVAVGLK